MESERHVFNQNIFVDDDIEIVTKKVFFRGASLHPRDFIRFGYCLFRIKEK